VHLVDVRKEQKKRVKNEAGSTRFVLVCDTPEAYSELHAEKDRIIKHCVNKSLAISLMIRAWRDALSEQELDRLLAALEVEEQKNNQA
jgi:hypothetical protein